jgi:hypothetical protein
MIFYDAFDLGNWSWTISVDAILLWVAAFLVLGIGILSLTDFVNKKGENDLIWSVVFIGLFANIYMAITSGSWSAWISPNFSTTIGHVIAHLLILAIPGLITTALLREKLGKKKLGDIFLLVTILMTGLSMLFLMENSTGQWEWVPIAARITQNIIIIPSVIVMIIVPLKKMTDNKEASLIFAFGCILLAIVFLIIGMIGIAAAIDSLDTATQGGIADFWIALFPFLILGSVLCFFDSLIVKPKKWKNMEVA